MNCINVFLFSLKKFWMKDSELGLSSVKSQHLIYYITCSLLKAGPGCVPSSDYWYNCELEMSYIYKYQNQKQGWLEVFLKPLLNWLHHKINLSEICFSSGLTDVWHIQNRFVFNTDILFLKSLWYCILYLFRNEIIIIPFNVYLLLAQCVPGSIQPAILTFKTSRGRALQNWPR